MTLTEHEKLGTERGVNDVKTGRVVSHDEVKLRYGFNVA